MQRNWGVMMLVILEAVGRILDMCRTSVNVWSDTCGCAVIARFEGEPVAGSVSADELRDEPT